MLPRCTRIHLGDHKGHTVFHPERAGVINHHSSRCHDRLTPSFGDRSAGRGEHQINALEGFGCGLLNDELLPLPRAATPSRTGGRQKTQFRYRKIPFLKELKKLLTHGTTGTQHSNG